MALYQLIIAYDGTDFLGFQKQRNGRTVQGEIEKALQSLGWNGTSVLASGRTDRGVHASGQVIAFDLDWPYNERTLQKALNSRLMKDVAVHNVRIADKGFHPRFSASARRYEYHVYFSEARDPLLDRFAWRVWPIANLELLQESAQILIGEHDFSAFGRPPNDEAGTIRTIFEAKWFKEKSGICFEVKANAFLYHMVRRAVFLQVKVGQGLLEMQAIESAVLGGKGIKPGIAPACGLKLAEVIY